MLCFLSISIQTCLSTCLHIPQVIEMDLTPRLLLALLRKETLPKNKGLIEHCNQSLKYPTCNHYCLLMKYIAYKSNDEELMSFGSVKVLCLNINIFCFLKKDMKYKHSTKDIDGFLWGSNNFRNSISHGKVLH